MSKLSSEVNWSSINATRSSHLRKARLLCICSHLLYSLINYKKEISSGKKGVVFKAERKRIMLRFSILPLLISYLCQIIFLLWGTILCIVGCFTLSLPLYTSSTSTQLLSPKMSPDIGKCPMGRKDTIPDQKLLVQKKSRNTETIHVKKAEFFQIRLKKPFKFKAYSILS